MDVYNNVQHVDYLLIWDFGNNANFAWRRDKGVFTTVGNFVGMCDDSIKSSPVHTRFIVALGLTNTVACRRLAAPIVRQRPLR